MNIKNPFPGPQPYRASDRDRFYGRDDLSYRLEGSLLANRCVTVYGPSGAGKSSLVQASVIPALIESQEIRVVRVDGWPEDKEPARWLASAMYSDLGFGDLPEDLSAEDALFAAAQRAARRSSRIVLVYLDQVEQLLYSSRSISESEAFFDCISRLVELPLRNLRVALSLREDYLGRFRDRLRNHRRILDHGFRVGPLTVGELCAAVCQAAAAGEPPQTWDTEPMRVLMLQVRVPGQVASDEAEAQSAYAQIVCRALFQERAPYEGSASEGRGESQSKSEAEPILRRYLEATLDDLGRLRASAQRLLEDHLVTVDGSRTLRTEKELLRILPLEELSPILKALEGAAILHAEEHQGSRYFEIGHDWLARKVFEERQQREREEEQRRREEEQQREIRKRREEAEARLAKERSQRLGFAITALVSIVIAVGTGAIGFAAYRDRQAAEAARHTAEDQRKIAVKKQVEAHDARILAGFRELSARGKLASAMKLLPEVQHPEMQRGWVELASDALNANALRSSLRGHEGPLVAALWSPDSKRVLTASIDMSARVWSADGQGGPLVLTGHKGPILSAAWSPDGKSVLTSSEDGTARVLRVDEQGGQAVVLEGHAGPVVSAAWSPDGKRVVTASSDATARVWNADGKGEVIVLKGHKSPLVVAVFHPDGARVITASEDATARVWQSDGRGKPVVLDGHRAPVISLAVSPDGKRIATTSRDKTARIWDATGKDKPVVLTGHDSVVYHAAFSPSGRLLATASADRTARLWSADGKGEPIILQGHGSSVSFVAWSPDGQYLASASADRTARLWPTGGGASLVLSGHEGPVRSVVWSRDGSRVLTAASDRSGGSADHSAKIWSTEPLRSLPRERSSAGIFHTAFIEEGGERIAAAYDNMTARLFRVDGEGTPITFRGHDAWIASAALSPDGERVVTASFDDTARIFRVDGTGAPVVLRGHEADVRSAAFSPDGSLVVTASDDKTARVFRADGTGEPVVLRGHEDWLSSAAFSPDGASVVTTSLDRTARVWKADGSGAVVVLSGHGDDVYAAAFSPDGTRIVTASADSTARVFRADGEGQAVVLKGHSSAVLRAIWSPDGKHIATSSASGSVRVWSADGHGTPIVLQAPNPIIAMAFLDGGQRIFTVASDNTTHTWMLDMGELKQRLATAHTDCLPVDARTLYLGEPARDAREKYDACELSHQRPPSILKVKAQ